MLCACWLWSYLLHDTKMWKKVDWVRTSKKWPNRFQSTLKVLYQTSSLVVYKQTWIWNQDISSYLNIGQDGIQESCSSFCWLSWWVLFDFSHCNIFLPLFHQPILTYYFYQRLLLFFQKLSFSSNWTCSMPQHLIQQETMDLNMSGVWWDLKNQDIP